jgi:hypothetical protein
LQRFYIITRERNLESTDNNFDEKDGYLLIDFIIILEKQFSYAKKVLLTREKNFHESFEQPLFEGEATAADVYVHGIEPLYKTSHKILEPEINESMTLLEKDTKLSLPNQYIELYERTLQLLKKIQLVLKEEDLNKPIMISSDSEHKIPLIEWIGLNIMHMLTHVGQALRLQSLYLRNMQINK